MNQSMNAWLRDYEARRVGGAGMSAKGLLSNRFDLEGLSWSEIREIPIQELGEDMTFGNDNVDGLIIRPRLHLNGSI